MTNKNLLFLQNATPSTGFHVLAAIGKNKQVRQEFLAELDAKNVGQFITAAVRQQQDLYFSVGTFNSCKRIAENAKSHKSFYIDLDVGATEGKYASKQEALGSLLSLSKHIALPQPTYIVDSGGGYHVYWTLEEEISSDEWWRHSALFKQALKSVSGFKFDATVVSDRARILRIPGTVNFKEAAPREAKLLLVNGTTTIGKLSHAFHAGGSPPFVVAAPQITPHAQVAPQDSTSGLMGELLHKPSSFKAILIKSVEGVGCRHLYNAVQNRAANSEPMWRAALSIAERCKDRNRAIIAVSADYPGYDFDTASAKAAATKGPYTCAEFDNLCPGVCATCPNNGRVKSPIVLGQYTESAVPITGANAQFMSFNGPVDVILNNAIAPSTAQINGVAFPYHRAIDGVYREHTQSEIADMLRKRPDIKLYPPPGNPGGPSTATKVLPYDFAVTSIGYDPVTREEMYGLALKLPNPADKLRTQTLSSNSVKGLDKWRNALGMGIISDHDVNTTRDIVISAVAEYRRHNSSGEVVRQLGWTDRNTFCLGKYELLTNGTIANAIPRPELRDISQHIEVENPQALSASTQAMKEFSRFWSQPGYEQGGLGLMAAFAAPLIALSEKGVNGGVVHLYSSQSGRGKSAIQAAVLSIWGEPSSLILRPQDTAVAKMRKINMMGSLPVCIEEITNSAPHEISDMAYQMTLGSEKARMNGQTLELYQPGGVFKTIGLTSGNASLIDKLCSIKDAPSGELNRIIELRLDRDLPSNSGVDRMVTALSKNHGALGAVYCHYLVNNRGTVINLQKAIRDELHRRLRFSDSDRFWEVLLTALITGATIATHELKIADFDLKHLLQYISEWFSGYRKYVFSRIRTATDSLVAYVASNSRNILYVHASGAAVLQGNLHMRYDIKTRILSIIAPMMENDLSGKQGDLAGVTTHMPPGAFRFLDKRRVQMGAGVTLPNVPMISADCYVYEVIDTTIITPPTPEASDAQTGT